MNAYGLQKMTLLDYPGKVACTIFTGGCNLRCPFCHNALLVTELDASAAIPEENVLDFLKKRAGLLDGVCVTGGEPLLQPDLADFLAKVKALGFSVKLDTNGSFPDRLKAIVEAGLVDYVAMDLKNDPEHYAETVGLQKLDFSPFAESIEYLRSGAVAHEFRTTVTAEFHTPERIEKIARLIASDSESYFLQSFVDSGKLIGEGLHAPSKQDLEEMKRRAVKFVMNVQLRGE